MTRVAFQPRPADSLQASRVFPALISFVCVVAGYALLVVGMRRYTGARGYVLALQAIAAFVLAEIAGKLLLVALR